MKINEKEVIGINQKFDEGVIVNRGSLDFALNSIRKSQDWQEQIVYLLRALLVDHIFKDGNKRTATYLLINALERENFDFHEEEIVKLSIKIAKESISDIKEIKKLVAGVVY